MPGASHPLAIGSKTWPGISKLIEECGEALQMCGKIAAFPFLARWEKHPDGHGIHARLMNEIADLEAIIWYVKRHNFTEAERKIMRERRDHKIQRFRRWHEQERAGE
jgi:hypothetical protein